MNHCIKLMQAHAVARIETALIQTTTLQSNEDLLQSLLTLFFTIPCYRYVSDFEGSTVGGVAQADIPVTDEFGCRVVYID